MENASALILSVNFYRKMGKNMQFSRFQALLIIPPGAQSLATVKGARLPRWPGWLCWSKKKKIVQNEDDPGYLGDCVDHVHKV